ncbi:hypothetical protein ES703_119760 [subsurface metagenome]
MPMIRGALRFPPTAPPNLPSWLALPWIDVVIRVPTLGIEEPFTMMVDTGSDITALHVRDVPRLGKRGYRLVRQSSNSRKSTGIGRLATYFGIPAQAVFEHEDSTLEEYDFDFWVAKPARKGSRRLATQLKIPSVLGRDLLHHFRMVMDYSNNQLFFDHN